ncbi:hypothetical protein BACI349Y_550024 [Bacillus sp. 349Y]|nr:hypothetical protein BACI349Y_550024 [Bacillus sp. 349Y]
MEELLEKLKELDSRMKEGHNQMMEKINIIQDHVDKIGQTLGITKKTESIQGDFEKTGTVIQQIKKIYSSTQ